MADPIYDPNALFGGASTQTNPDAGNTPFTQVYGQRRSSPLSMDEYLSGSMYDFPGINTGIDVSAAPDLDEDEKDKDQAAPPNILTPVSERTNDPSSVFRAISQGGQLGTGYRVSAKDPSKYLDDLINAETFTVKEDGFSKYAQQKFTEGGGAATAVASLATGMPLTVLGAGAAAFAQKQNKKNAQAILQTGGGDLFELNGATVSRAPGERIFTGNLGGFSQGQLYAAREMDFGFIPGSMREMVGARATAEIGAGPTGIPTTRTGNRGVQAAGKVSGHIMDAYGTIHGVSDESGVMQVGAIAAQRMRENEFRQNMIAAGLRSELNNMIADKSFTMNAVRAKQHTDGIMKAGQGFRFRAANVPADQYAKALNDRGKTYQDYVKSTHGTTSTTKVDTSQPDDFVPSVTESRSEANRIREAERDAAFERGQAVRDRMMDQGVESDPQETSPTQYSMSDFADDYAASYEGVTDFGFRRGGRVDMAEGDTPQGTFEPGFVEGPPENFTERETVADDQNGKVKPDTFIINAAAVEIAGSEDIRKMLMKAYEVAVQKGLDIGRVDRKLYEGTIDVALSKGEVVVPPELAKIIGYDRLRKINNRGKKEVASRQKKAGGGFLAGKKDGGEVTRPTSKPSLVERRKDEALADVELRADLEAYIKKDKLARLGWDLYSKGQIDMTGVALRNPETGREYGSSSLQGVYFPKKGQEMYPGGDEASKADTDQTVIARLARIQSGKAIRTDIPSVYYYGEKNPRPQIRKDEDGNIINTPQELSRAGVFITIAHELRHAALNYIHNEGGVKNIIGPLRMEERLMDYYDYHNRLTASKSDSSVPPVAPNPDQAGRQEFASYDHMQKELYEYYENIAAAALKGRKVPPRAKRIKKNFFEKFISDLFN